MKYLLLTAGLALSGLLVGCSGDDGKSTVTVTLKVSICTDAGADCYALGVPQAKVELRAVDGTVPVTATTDDAGVARFEVPEGFVGGEVVAQSALLEGGRASAPLRYPGQANAITMMGKLATPQAVPVS